jgi:acyl carrier protein
MVSLDHQVRATMAAVLGVDRDALSDEDSPETIESWDSVAHLHLMLALEAEFDVRFSPDEIAGLTSVRSIKERLEQPGRD